MFVNLPLNSLKQLRKMHNAENSTLQQGLIRLGLSATDIYVNNAFLYIIIKEITFIIKIKTKPNIFGKNDLKPSLNAISTLSK